MFDLSDDDFHSRDQSMIRREEFREWLGQHEFEDSHWSSSIKERKYTDLPLDLFAQRYNGQVPHAIFNEEVSFRDLKKIEGKLVASCEIQISPPMDDGGISGYKPAGLFELPNGLFVQVALNIHSSDYICHVVVLYTASMRQEAVKWMSQLKVHSLEFEPSISYLIQNMGGGFDFESTKIPPREIDYDHYNEGFKEFDDNLKEWVKDWTTCGLAIVHGPPGTGKTTYLRHLTSVVPRATYIPPSMSEDIGSPAFLGFLSQHKKRVYFIEDAENIIVSDGERRSSALANLLNATDGIMGDIIQSKFILTFNTDIREIDKALLRPGRMRHAHQFNPLTPEKTEKLLKKLNKEAAHRPMSLAEIFNSPAIDGLTKPKEKIGF